MDLQNSPVPKTTSFCLNNPQIPQGWVFRWIGHLMAIYFNCQCPFWKVLKKVFSDVNRKLLKKITEEETLSGYLMITYVPSIICFMKKRNRKDCFSYRTELLLYYIQNEFSHGLRFLTLKIMIPLIFKKCFTLKIYCERPALYSVLLAILWEPF